jgi:hypothetical protein
MEYKEITNFTTINRGVSPFLIGEGELADIKNFHTDKLGSLTKTGDYTIKNAQITAGMAIYNGVDYISTTGTHFHLVAINGSSYAKVYTDTALPTDSYSPSRSPSLSPSLSPSA